MIPTVYYHLLYFHLRRYLRLLYFFVLYQIADQMNVESTLRSTLYDLQLFIGNQGIGLYDEKFGKICPKRHSKIVTFTLEIQIVDVVPCTELALHRHGKTKQGNYGKNYFVAK